MECTNPWAQKKHSSTVKKGALDCCLQGEPPIYAILSIMNEFNVAFIII